MLYKDSCRLLQHRTKAYGKYMIENTKALYRMRENKIAETVDDRDVVKDLEWILQRPILCSAIP